ncbi:MAG: L,D-transpeptidase [Chloroflexi bacterium]|nr:L,D-transpeptidase [Chloroflexota bacterium]
MKSFNQLSRRDFLKLSAAGALGLALAELRFDRVFAAPPSTQGRITWSGIPLYDAPSFNAKKVRVFGRDQVIDLAGEVEGDEGNPYNKAWYKVDNGYTYSGWIQPVETKYQKTNFELSAVWQLGEITVPVSETRISPYVYAKNGYRLYYGSTHWVKAVVVTREEKSIWYEIYDTHLRVSFYVPTYNMRLIPDDELALLSPDVPDAEKNIHVDLTEQLVTAFEGETMVFSSRCSSGAKGTRTPAGDFSTYHKGPSIHMTNQGDAVNNIYDLPGVPWCSFFSGDGAAFHGTYWHNDYGRPRSHGCVNLPSEAAKFIYCWTRPKVPVDTDYLHLPGQGTRVQIVSSNS